MTRISYLRKTLWGIGSIILIELVKRILAKSFPVATVFHNNFLSLVQGAILLGTIIVIISGSVTSRKTTGINFLILFLLLALPEILFTYWLHHPSRIPSFLFPAFKNYYNGIQRNIIQLNAGCSTYDSSLLYTLRPSSRFIFNNYEFSDTFYTNKSGLRDDQRSLLQPEIICLGDSYTMGWGVQQQETFPELLSRRSGKIVLNAAISSYGTARELKNLSRLDTSNLQYLILQYSRNDDIENAQFVKANYSLKISPKQKYDSTVNFHSWSKVWFPGKHFIAIAKLYAATKLAGLLPVKRKKAVDSSPSPLHPPTVFADILLHSAINFKNTKVFVLDINERGAMNDDFLNEVKTVIGSPYYKEHFNNNLIMVPVSDLLDEKDYYILDDHLRSSGHLKIAEQLSKYMFPGK